MDKDFFHLKKNVLLVCTYVPPNSSPYYAVSPFDNGIAMLEENILDTLFLFDDIDVDLLVYGDLNARTAEHSPDILNENQLYENNCKDDIYHSKRCS
jgi:hypothetical protein